MALSKIGTNAISDDAVTWFMRLSDDEQISIFGSDMDQTLVDFKKKFAIS